MFFRNFGSHVPNCTSSNQPRLVSRNTTPNIPPLISSSSLDFSTCVSRPSTKPFHPFLSYQCSISSISFPVLPFFHATSPLTSCFLLEAIFFFWGGGGIFLSVSCSKHFVILSTFTFKTLPCRLKLLFLLIHCFKCILTKTLKIQKTNQDPHIDRLPTQHANSMSYKHVTRMVDPLPCRKMTNLYRAVSALY